MKIERLEVRHLTSLTQVVLDCTALPPSGLIAITGVNGTGKTTLLESAIAGLYRTLPSRGGELVDYATDSNTVIDVRLAVEGVGTFHSRVQLDGIRRASEAVLAHQDVPITDGKVTTFDAAVRRHFPSLTVLLASAMSAQNRHGNFIQKKPKERKELFQELLALGHLEEMSQTAKGAASLIDGERERLVAARKELHRRFDPALGEQYAADDQHIQAEIATVTGERRRLAAQVERLETEATAAEGVVRAHLAAMQRADTYRAEFVARQAEQNRLASDGEALETTYQQDLKRLTERAKTSRETVARKHKETVADLEKRMATAQKTLSQAEAIKMAVAALARLDEQERALRAQLDTQAGEVGTVSDQRASLQQQLALLAQPEHELARARQDAQLIDAVPFGARCAEAGCQFLKGAVAAQATVPGLERQLAGKPEMVARVGELTATITTLRAAVDALARELGLLARERAEHQTLADLAEKVTIAETRIAELSETRDHALKTHHARLEELAADLDDAKADVTTRRATARAALDQRATTLAAALEGLREHVRVADAEAAKTADGYADGQRVQHTLATTREQHAQTGATLAALGVEATALAAARRDFAEATARIERLTGKLAYLDTERTDWHQLARALGRDGVPVLEMDAAGPRISELCNALLTACFGPRFSVELVTQQAKTGGTGMKESFELLVTDNERGGEPREVADLSGGEQVIVSEALMNAIALYVNQHAPMPIRTCWRDETTGALDPENAARYFQMLRQVQALGGYHHIFFVTHNPAIAALADAQIHVADGLADVRLPPYEAAA